MHFARFVGAPHWRDDQHLRGFIYVAFENHILKVYPKNSMMTLAIPSLEWVEKYKDHVWCLLERVEDKDSWAWAGVALLKDFPSGDEFFDEALSSFPYLRMMFSENWKVVLSDAASGDGDDYFRLHHEDGTELIIHRQDGDEYIRIEDGVTANLLLMNKDQIVLKHGVHGHEVVMNEDEIHILHGSSDAEIVLKVDGSIELKGSGSAVISGVITQLHPCAFTGGPHPQGSLGVKASR